MIKLFFTGLSYCNKSVSYSFFHGHRRLNFDRHRKRVIRLAKANNFSPVASDVISCVEVGFVIHDGVQGFLFSHVISGDVRNLVSLTQANKKAYNNFGVCYLGFDHRTNCLVESEKKQKANCFVWIAKHIKSLQSRSTNIKKIFTLVSC